MRALDFIVTIWSWIAVIAFIVSFLSFIALFSYLISDRDEMDFTPFKRKGIIIGFSLGGIVLLLFLFYGLIKYCVRTELQKTLARPDSIITIRGTTISNSAYNELKNKLVELIHPEPNHSSPDKEIRLVIKNKTGNIYLTLGRDNCDKTIYWVFVDNYRTTSMNEIGKIQTNLLDNF